MHRHRYKGRKLGREKDQRKALLKSLADSLIINESIETTLSKAKEVVPYTEKLLSKAKDPTLSNRRLTIKKLQTLEAANKLFDDITPKINKSRSSGYLRITKTTLRRGDNAQMAIVSFVDDLQPKDQVKAANDTRDSKPKKSAEKAKS